MFTSGFRPWLRNNKSITQQPRRRRQQKPHKFADLTMETSIFARTFFMFWHFEDVIDIFYDVKSPVLQLRGRREHMMTNVQFCLLICPRSWFQFNSRIVRTHFSSMMTLNNWKMIAETRRYTFRWRSRFRRRRDCLSSLMFGTKQSLAKEFFFVTEW